MVAGRLADRGAGNVRLVPYGDDDVVRKLLALNTWAVVGLSGDPNRAATGVAAFLQQHGKRVVPVHPTATAVLGERVYPTLDDIPFGVDVVNVFRRSSAAGEYADRAVHIAAKGVWFQLGVVDEEAYERTTRAGLDMVMDRCPKIDWPWLGPR